MADGTLITDDEPATAKPGDKVERPGRANAGDIQGVRMTDIEPYTGLRYLSKLFRFMAVIMLLLLVAEIATGVYTQGAAAIPTLLGEASRLIVLAGVLWGTGDFAHLLIDVGHDVRATRILASRLGHAAKLPPLTPSRAASDQLADRIGPFTDGTRTDRVVDRARYSDTGDSGEGPPIP